MVRAHVAHVAGHALAREHAARRLALADRAGRAVEQRRAVGGRATREVVALDRAREALADRGAGDVHDLAGREHVHLDLGARREVRAFAVGEAELDQRLARGDLGLGVVPGQRARQAGGLAVAEGDLHRAITVALDGLHLGDAVRQGLDHRHRDRFARVREDARHAGLAANQTDRHRFVLVHRPGCDWPGLKKTPFARRSRRALIEGAERCSLRRIRAAPLERYRSPGQASARREPPIVAADSKLASAECVARGSVIRG